MVKRIIFFIVLAIAAQNIKAQNWKPVSGSVTFKLKMMGVNVDGKLGGMKANLQFENGTPVAINATVDAATVNTSNNLRDSHLKTKPEFFQPEKYPTLRMKTSKITKTSKGYEADFELSIKNVTKTLKVPFVFEENGNTGKMSATFNIDRTKWNFGGNTLGMADNVQVKIDLNIQK